MDVSNRALSSRVILLAAGFFLSMSSRSLADPVYTALDLGAGTPSDAASSALSYGVDSSGNGTVTGSNGLTYTFNPVQNYLPATGNISGPGVPTPEPAPIWDQNTYGNPNFAFSYSTLYAMNSSGLAAGINQFGVVGHLANSEAFITQLQPDGKWGAPTPLWSGYTTFAGSGPSNIGIMGVSPGGQVLGYGVVNQFGPPVNTLYLYDSKTHALTDLTSLVNSITWTNSTAQPLGGQSPNWFLQSVVSRLDNQGRILIQASEGFIGPVHNVLLVPDGIAADPPPIPEPGTWAVFATLIGAWMAQKRLRSRSRS
jgi:hypothetical protein